MIVLSNTLSVFKFTNCPSNVHHIYFFLIQDSIKAHTSHLTVVSFQLLQFRIGPHICVCVSYDIYTLKSTDHNMSCEIWICLILSS